MQTLIVNDLKLGLAVFVLADMRLEDRDVLDDVPLRGVLQGLDGIHRRVKRGIHAFKAIRGKRLLSNILDFRRNQFVGTVLEHFDRFFQAF